MKLISYKTWKKHNPGSKLGDSFKFCGGDIGYLLLKSVYPKDIATIVIHNLFSKEEEDMYEFVYWPHPYKGKKYVDDSVDVWCRKIK